MRQTLDLQGLVRAVRPFTMVDEGSLTDLAQQVHVTVLQGTPGHFVECGVWRGGAAFLIALVLKQLQVRDRRVWLFDSFEGLPPPQPIDGPGAADLAANPSRYFDNCTASIEEVQTAARQLGVEPYVELVKGWFHDTLPRYKARVGPIAVLRIDADWYESVSCCLTHLYDQVVSNGFIVFDDYYSYDGCAVALHEFLGARQIHHRVESLPLRGEANAHYMNVSVCKGPETWALMRARYLLGQDIASVVPADQTLILAGTKSLVPLIPPYPAEPFESRICFWSSAQSDDAAIAELNGFRRDGATFVAFAWPAFWWLDYYRELAAYLRANGRSVLENDRVVIFALEESPRSLTSADRPMSVVFTSRTSHQELLQKSQSLIDCPITPVTDMTAQEYLFHVLFSLQTEAEWLVNIDEDVFALDYGRILDLIHHMERHGFEAAGLPDGGYLRPRSHNPLVLNPFFNVFNLRRIRSLSNLDYSSMSPDLIAKAPVTLSRQYRYDDFEPFYPLFFALHRANIRFLYLAGETHSDGISTILHDHEGRPLLIHTWFGRRYHEPAIKQRIDDRYREVRDLRDRESAGAGHP
jgi:O-methyltransferase